jgi:DNA processing protein
VNSFKKHSRYWLTNVLQAAKTFGNPSNIFDASYSQLKEVVSDAIAAEITKGINHDALSGSLRWLSQPDNHLVTLADNQYPKALLEITDPPAFLYAKGNLALINQPSIAIVGSRNASVQGEKNAEAFARGLSEYGLCIVSGLALGIEALRTEAP